MLILSAGQHAHHGRHCAASACRRHRNSLVVREVGGVWLGRWERSKGAVTRPAGRQVQHDSGSVGQQSGVLVQSLGPLTGSGYYVEVLAEAKNVEEGPKHGA